MRINASSIHRLFTSSRELRKSVRRRGTARLFILSTAIAAGGVHGVAAMPANDVAPAGRLVGGLTDEFQFEIPAGPLSMVLPMFESATKMTVSLALETIGAIQSPGVTGRMTAAAALQVLLAGTGVVARSVTATTAVLELRTIAESIEVVGSAAPAVASAKYVESLRNIPQTISLISRDVIEKQAAFTLSDALRNVPGITLQAGEGGGASSTAGDMFNMRGFSAANSLFVDGVRDDGLIARDVFNIEQVEVFMGPTGSDIGRGTASGYVNMTTKSPRLQAEHSALLSVGTADQKRATIDLNLPLAPQRLNTWVGKSAVRLNALVQDSGTPGRRDVESKRTAFAPSLGLGFGTPTRVTASAQIMRQENTPDYGIPGAAWLEEPIAPTTERAPRAVDQRNYYGSLGVDYDDASQDSVTAKVEHDVNARVTVRNQARYSKTHREAVISAIQNVAAYSAATNLVTIARQGNERENVIASNQTSVNARFATGSVRHASSLGAEYTFERQDAPGLEGFGTVAPKDIFNPNTLAPVTGFAPVRAAAFTRGRTATFALYAFDTVDLTTHWQVTGGLRWERYDATFNALTAAGVATDLEAADSLISGKAGLIYRLTPFASAYVSYGTTVTPPGTANFTLSGQANNQNNPNVEPQRSTNYEIGGKWDMVEGRLSLNAAVFRTDNENVIFTIDAATIPPLFNQDDEQRVQGVQLGAVGRINERWEILTNFGYFDAEQRSQGSATNGRRLTLTPQLSGSIWTTYALPIKLTLGGGIRFTDDVFINAANTIKLPGYQLVDAMAEYEVNTFLSLRFNART